DVAEPHGHVARAAVAGSHVPEDQLRHAFGRAHDTGWVHGLVAGNQHAALDAILTGRLRDAHRADDVVLGRLADVQLHQRHVFVRGSVEDDVGPEITDDLVQSPYVGHV